MEDKLEVTFKNINELIKFVEWVYNYNYCIAGGSILDIDGKDVNGIELLNNYNNYLNGTA